MGERGTHPQSGKLPGRSFLVSVSLPLARAYTVPSPRNSVSLALFLFLVNLPARSPSRCLFLAICMSSIWIICLLLYFSLFIFVIFNNIYIIVVNEAMKQAMKLASLLY